MTDTILVPEAITFEQAIAFTQSLMTQMQAAQISEPDLEATLTDLLSSANGARGFFVTYLTDDCPLADQPSAAVIRALRSAPTVPELLVKNLAMSSAMAVAHRRNRNEAMAQGSDRVQARTANLIQQVQMAEVREQATQLCQSAATGSGEYAAFLQRWGYDAEQRQVIEQQMQRALGA